MTVSFAVIRLWLLLDENLSGVAIGISYDVDAFGCFLHSSAIDGENRLCLLSYLFYRVVYHFYTRCPAINTVGCAIEIIHTEVGWCVQSVIAGSAARHVEAERGNLT